jgi:adenylate cyclase
VPPRLSIVVLPFVNLSNDLEQEYFADGFTDNLTTDVSYIEGSFVIARNTAFAYKGKTVDTREIGRELGVRYVLEGSVQRSADQIRINAQLIDAETASQLWAETFDRDRSDLYVIEDEVTKLIARTLDRQLTKIEAEQAARRSPSGIAVDYIMRGDAILERHESKDSYRAAEEMYERALQLDPRFPRALTGVAGMLVGRVLNDFSDAREDDLRRADELVSRALAIDPNYADAHGVKGQILRERGRYEEAIAEYETEVALNPLALSGLSHLARTEILIGEPAKAVPLLERAMRMSPRDSGIGHLQWRLGYAYLLLGNTNEAVKWTQKSVVTFYDKTSAYLNLAAALGLMGDNTAAQAALAEAIKLDPAHSATIAKARAYYSGSKRAKFVELREQTLIEGLRKAGLPE